MLTLPELSVDDASWSLLISHLLGEVPVDDLIEEDQALQCADVAAWRGEVLEQSAVPQVTEERARPISAVPPFLVPVDRSDPAAPPVSYPAVVEGPALRRLDELAARCDVSEAAVLLALWRTLIDRYRRDADDRMVVLADGRSTRGLENVLGLLEWPVPVRLAIAADTSVADALQAAQEALDTVAEMVNQVDPASVPSVDGGSLSFRHRVDRWADELWDDIAGYDAPGPLHLDCVRGPRSLRLNVVGTAGRITSADLEPVAAAFEHELADVLSGGTERAVGSLRLTAEAAPVLPPERSDRPATVLDRFQA
ncbi:hypothetical protein [Micromonospora chersina]|uniref:hypothetical protein n=1 Tax=Micromonospora chersina TaxID=47854 RepID=UPI003712CFE0